MTWYEILGLVVASGILGKMFDLIMDRIKRHDTVTDKETEEQKAEKKERDKTAEQLKVLKDETTQQFAQVDKRFQVVEQKLNAQGIASKAQLYNTISQLGNKYIAAGEVSNQDLKGFIELFEAYKELHMDIELTDGPKASYEYLMRVSNEVNKLRIKP